MMRHFITECMTFLFTSTCKFFFSVRASAIMHYSNHGQKQWAPLKSNVSLMHQLLKLYMPMWWWWLVLLHLFYRLSKGCDDSNVMNNELSSIISKIMTKPVPKFCMILTIFWIHRANHGLSHTPFLVTIQQVQLRYFHSLGLRNT